MIGVNHAGHLALDWSLRAKGRAVLIRDDGSDGNKRRTNRRCIVGNSWSDIEVEEHPVSLQPSIYGNVDRVGVCFAFVDSPRTTRLFGMNFMSTTDGVRIWRNVLQMARQGRIRAVVGKEIEFDNVPRALEAIERRETTGRTVVHAPPNTAD